MYAKGVERRQEILDRALEVFAERGVDGTSLRAIGEAIGVSHAALRHYFDSREALLVEVLRERDRKTGAGITGDTVLDRMASTAGLNAGTPGAVALYTSLLATSVEHGDVVARDFFVARFARLRRELARELGAELRDRGAAQDADLEQVAALIVAAFDGLQAQWLLDPTIDIGGTLRLIERVLR